MEHSKKLSFQDFMKSKDFYGSVSTGAAAVRVPRVPGHPLNFDNGCQAPVLRDEPQVIIVPISLQIPSFCAFRLEKIGLNPEFFWAGHPSSESPGAAPDQQE